MRSVLGKLDEKIVYLAYQQEVNDSSSKLYFNQQSSVVPHVPGA